MKQKASTNCIKTWIEHSCYVYSSIILGGGTTKLFYVLVLEMSNMVLSVDRYSNRSSISS